MPAEDSTPRIEQQDAPEGPLLLVLGAWTAAGLTHPPVWAALTAQLNELSGLRGHPGAFAAGP